MTLGERLKLLRKQNKLTQIDVAKILGIDNSTLSKWESDINDVDTENLGKLAKLYNTTTDYLTGNKSFSVAGQEVTLSPEEAKVFMEMRKHPKFNVMFHDLASNPEKKVKMLVKMWETIKATLDEDDEDRGDGFGDLSDDK